MLKKYLSCVLSFSLVMSVLAMIESPKTAKAATIVSQVAKNGSKGYLQVDGKPFTMMGVQSFGEWQRFGNGNMSPIPTNQNNPILTQDWLENTFEKTAAAGFKTIQIELAWNQIEPTSEGQYSWTLLDKYVNWANKYGLRIDFVWWGTNGCGGGILPNSAHGFMQSVPTYLADLNKYWGNGGNGEENFPWLPITGSSHYNDADYLFGRERAAVTAMFNHLATYDTNHRVILFQVGNEINYHSEWSSQNSLWLNLINQLGGAVKNSNYVVATRVNLVGSRIPNSDINNLANIDFVGPDDYNWNVSDIASAIKDTATKSDIAYIPETYSNNSYLTSIAATALVNGGFIDFWQLNDSWAGGNYAFYGTTANGYPTYTTWTLGTIPTMPPGVIRMKNFNAGLNKMSQLIATTLPQNMAGFNIETNIPNTSYNGSEVLVGANVTYIASDASIGMALYDSSSNSYYLVSDTAGNAIFNLGVTTTAQAGYFDANGTWVSQGNRTVATNGDIQINSQEVLKVSNVNQTTQNLALNKTVTTSSSYSGQTALNAVDGSSGTQWSAGSGTFPQWLTVDLGGSYSLASIKQTFAETDNSTYKYKIEGSTNNTTWSTLVDRTGTGVTTSTTITEPVNGTYRYVRLTITSITNSHWANSKEFQVYGNSNLALGKTVTVSSAYTGQVGSNAVDGSSSTQWTAGSGTFNQWFSVDLGNSYNLSSIKQTFGETDNSTYKYKIEGSTDNSSWTTLVDRTGTGVTSNTTITEPVSGMYRYIRLTVTNITNSHWANSKEFEVY